MAAGLAFTVNVLLVDDARCFIVACFPTPRTTESCMLRVHLHFLRFLTPSERSPVLVQNYLKLEFICLHNERAAYCCKN